MEFTAEEIKEASHIMLSIVSTYMKPLIEYQLNSGYENHLDNNELN